MSGFVVLSLQPGLAPMEAKLAEQLPERDSWRYEPKWDGFRCLAFRAGDEVFLQSKGLKPLNRYFPDVVDMLRGLHAERFILDGELVIPVGKSLSFDALQMRLHPAESRVRKLAAETPAEFILFDCLDNGVPLHGMPFEDRRAALEALHAAEHEPRLLLSPQTRQKQDALAWLDEVGPQLDGVVAKRADLPYLPGERAMIKVKRMRTADCVVGGFRYGSGSREVASLLLGLFDDAGRLNHVGFTSNLPRDDRGALTRELEALIEPPGFTGDAPGGPSRWSNGRSQEWQPLRWERVAEVRYDHVTAGRFRHGTRFLRWRPDKAPEQCRMDQFDPRGADRP